VKSVFNFSLMAIARAMYIEFSVEIVYEILLYVNNYKHGISAKLWYYAWKI
jgi:hypothetical protein